MPESSDGATSGGNVSRATTLGCLSSRSTTTRGGNGSEKTEKQSHGACWNKEQSEKLTLERECLRRAIERFNQDLLDHARKRDLAKFYITLEGNPSFAPVTVADLLEQARKAQDSIDQERGTVVNTLRRIASSFQRHARAIDGFIQHEPNGSALIWGSVRVFLQAFVDIKQATECTAEGIELIAQHAARSDRIICVFGDSQSIQDALVEMYYHTLHFLQPAIYRSQKSSIARFGHSLWQSERDRTMGRVRKLREAAERLEKEAGLKSQEHTKQTLELLRISQVSKTAQHSQSLQALAQGFEAKGVLRWLAEMAGPGTFHGAVTSEADPAPWLTRHPKFQAWADKSHNGILWVHGPPGSGKSFLAQRTVYHLHSLEQQQATGLQPRMLLFHAFRGQRSASDRSPVRLAANLLMQLIKSFQPAEEGNSKHALTVLTRLQSWHSADSEACIFDEMWELCGNLIRSRQNPSCTMVIDGLDECDFDNNKTESELFLHSLRELVTLSPVKILIFSQPRLNLGIGIASDPLSAEIQIHPSDTLADINALCDKQSDALRIPHSRKVWAVQKAKANANGSFLWVIHFFKAIASAKGPERLREAIDNFPPTFWDLYYDTWSHRFANLDAYDQTICRQVFIMLLGARRPLAYAEVVDAIRLFPEAALSVISKGCEPLVEICGKSIALSHASVREFLLDVGNGSLGAGAANRVRFEEPEPDATLARLCLQYLQREEYRQLDSIGRLLKKNIQGGQSSAEAFDAPFYHYAALYWVYHLQNLSSPDPELLERAGDFLRSRSFVYWAEYVYKDLGDLQAIRSAERRLTLWSKVLPPKLRDLLHLNDYFVLPYGEISAAYQKDNNDKILQWMALMHQGLFLFDKGRIAEMCRVRLSVAEGLIQLLGPRNSLTLKARSEAAYAPFFQGRLEEARRIYTEIAEDQRKVNLKGKMESSVFSTILSQGQVEVFMTRYLDAATSCSKAKEGFARTLGKESSAYQSGQFWQAVANASIGDGSHLPGSIETMEEVRKKREEDFGESDTFAVTTRIFVGDMYRRNRQKDLAISNLKFGLEFRRAVRPLSHYLAMDTALILIMAYRDFEMDEEAGHLLEEIEECADFREDFMFSRLCQTRHLEALLLFDAGEKDNPILKLQELLIETDRKNNNRELLWIRLDLAHMLRNRDEEGDRQTAAALFDEIVQEKEKEGGGEGEPDSPRLLKAAEQALSLVRSGKREVADLYLGEQDLQWVCDKDFWISFGSPPADTRDMKPPRQIDKDNASQMHRSWVHVLRSSE